MTRPSDLLPGTLDMLILRTLQKEALHGWAISERIQAISEDVLQITQGSLYPALHRLELRGEIRSEMTLSENNRRARVYTITRTGRKRLEVERRSWEQFALSIQRVLDPGHPAD